MKCVINRQGNKELFDVGKISKSLSTLCVGLDGRVDSDKIVDKLSNEISSGMEIHEIGQLASEIAAALALHHPDYSMLAGRIALSHLYKFAELKFSTLISRLYHQYDPISKDHAPIIHEEKYNLVMKYADVLDGALQHCNDELFDYFAIKTLKKTFLKKIDGVVIERPQHMLMRVALEINGGDIDSVLRTYELLSKHYYTHATPTIVNACTTYNQLSSCFLAPVRSDSSISGVYDTLKDCAVIGEHGGGVGLSISGICSSKGSLGGGIVPLLRLFNNSIRYTSEFSPRKSGVAMYIEPWHADIFEFLELRKNHGNENERARDVYTGLWVPNLFMERVRDDGHWTLMCPQTCPGLDSSCGVDFDCLYTRYEQEGRGRKISARNLWFAILHSQIETGTPYMLYKDHCNNKSNQQNLGTIRCSNLCTEVVQYSSDDEVAVCNLASINLRRFVIKDVTSGFDFEKLKEVSAVITRNLNLAIDHTHYPLVEAERSNKRHRPIGIGVQGLADVFQIMDLPYDSSGARQLNKDIFETMYYGACDASAELAQKDGPYESYPGSPASNGMLQYDLWGVDPSPMWDWVKLKKKIRLFGLRNSLLLAPMPTATTAQVLGSSEGTDPLLSNVYNRRVDAGEFIVANRYLVKKLSAIGLWTDEVRNMIVANRGSIQSMSIIPDGVRSVFKTAWEIPQRVVLDMAADRGAFVCQSQSTNVYMANPTIAKLTSLHFHSWAIGLKTGMYYLRTRPKADPIHVNIDTAGGHALGKSECNGDGDLCSSCGA